MTEMKANCEKLLNWKNMDADTDNMVRECKKCNKKHNIPPRLEPHPWEKPAAP